jgi:hypothetical protein
MGIKTNNPAPHAGETEAPAIPKDGKTPGMGAPPEGPAKGFTPPIDREPGTREDGEAMPPTAIDPEPDGKQDDRPASGKQNLSEVDEPHAGTPDQEAGEDDFRQRPITDNKAGG